MICALLATPLLVCGACGGSTASIDADAGARDAGAPHRDSGGPASDSAARGDGAPQHTPDGGEGDACPVLPADAAVQCGKACSFPGYFSPCPSDPGNPLGVSCRAIVDGGGPIWFCSEG